MSAAGELVFSEPAEPPGPHPEDLLEDDLLDLARMFTLRELRLRAAIGPYIAADLDREELLDAVRRVLPGVRLT